jgi:hypothetical protein
MHKKIAFSLLLITALAHGMDVVIQQKKENGKYVLGGIIAGLYIESHFRKNESGKKEYCGWHDEGVVRSLGRDLQALACVNTSFSQKLSKEKKAKKLITIISENRKMCDEKVAYHLNPKGGIFHTIVQKMDRLLDIVTDADKQFTQEDLKDAWYINASHQVSHSWLRRKMEKYKYRDVTRPQETGMKFRQMAETLSPHTLLSLAFKAMDFEKIEQLLAAGADCKNKINNALLLDIAKKRVINFGKHKNRRVHYFMMVQLLLKHGAYPDYPCSPKSPTPLMIAAHNNDQEYALLLLQHFADPYCVTYAHMQQMEYPFWYHKSDGIEKNACDVEQGEPEGWLTEMFDIIEKRRSLFFKYWFLKNNVPLEVAQLIMQNVLKSHRG